MNIDPVTMVLLVFYAILLFFLLPIIQQLLTEEFKWPSLFRAGVLIYLEERSLPWPLTQLGAVFVTEYGRFKNAGPGLCLFHSLPTTLFFYDRHYWIMGRILWTGGRARVEVRLSILMALYALILPAVLTYYALGRDTVQFRNWIPIDSTVFVPFVWIMIAVLVYSVVMVARSDAKKLVGEYEAYVTTMHAPRLWQSHPEVETGSQNRM